MTFPAPTALRLLIAWIAMASALSLGACAYSSPKNTAMNTAGWNTHCFGRFLIDLPPEARIGASYKIRGDQMKRLPISHRELEERVSYREQELKAQTHETEGTMFIRRVDHGGSSISLISWESPRRKRMKREDAYFVANDGTVFSYGGMLSADREHVALDNSAYYARKLRSRAPDETPAGPGFCIDGGYIAGQEFMNEEFRVGIALPEHPGMQMSFRSRTGAAGSGLLERAGGFLRTEVLGGAAGLDTLRKRRRPVGPIPGEEYLVAASDKGQRVYAFKWETQGKDASLSEPNLGLDLGVLERDTDDDGNPPPPAFESDEEALQLWDAIIDSIRLRPGAA